MYRETGKWVNCGDINFFEYGGCQVSPTYSKEEIEEYPEKANQQNGV